MTEAELKDAAFALPAADSLFSIELSPASVRVSRRSGLRGRPQNYKERTAITEWSRKSRASMVSRLCTLDYAPLFSDPTQPPAMLTLTYPADWQAVAPDGATAKRHLRAFQKRYERAFGEPLRAVWKMEFQRRGAVHFHIFCTPPRGVKFRSWLSEAWSEIVATPDPIERAKHLAAGTGLDYEQGLRAVDAKRIAVYFSKHGSANFGDKEYQNRPPALRVEAGSIGRFWGYWGLEPLTVTTEVSEADALFIARTLRRWARANSRSRRVTVWRINQRTGEIRPRRAHRRSVRLTSRTSFVAVNDESAMGQALSRALAMR